MKHVKRNLAIGMLMVISLILIFGLVLTPTLDPRNIEAWWRHHSATAPMPFYAKVVDEEGQPVEGATIHLRLNLHDHRELIGRGFMREEFVVLTTNADGRAELGDYTGFDVKVENVSKLGYKWLYDADSTHRRGQVLTNMRGFHYGNLLTQYTADPDNPAVFPLYREGVTEPDPGAGEAAWPSRGGFTDGVRGEPFWPRESSLEED